MTHKQLAVKNYTTKRAYAINACRESHLNLWLDTVLSHRGKTAAVCKKYASTDTAQRGEYTYVIFTLAPTGDASVSLENGHYGIDNAEKALAELYRRVGLTNT